MPGAKAAGKNIFYRRHSQILQDIGLLDDGYPIYGDKHTGAANLYLATKGIEVVRRHCRHANASQTTDYLHGIGILQNE